MKGVKGKLLKKLKSMKPVGYLTPDRILQDGFVDVLHAHSVFKLPKTLFAPKESDHEKLQERNQVPNVEDLMRDVEEDDDEQQMEVDCDENIHKENMTHHQSKNSGRKPLAEIDTSSFRRPDLDSGTLFDPNLLAAFAEAVKEHNRMSQATKVLEEEEEPPLKTRRIEEEKDKEEEPLSGFELKCPPGGSDSVILYTTTLRGVRRTYEECNSVRFLLESFRVVFFERDVSMHVEFREELWEVLQGKVTPPRLFIKGRYIGGADEVLRLHEAGQFRVLFDGIPIDTSVGPCESCAGFRFVVCFKCSGSHRMVQEDGVSLDCLHCNENGLIVCPLCC